MRHTIDGTVMPVLQIGLEPGDTIVAEPGEFAWMSDNIALHTTTRTAGAQSVWGALGRAFAGGGLFMTEFTAQGSRGMVAFAAKVPGSILPLEVSPGHGYFIHRHGFLCGTTGITLALGFQRRLGVGLFGGAGFILQRLGGFGTAFVELGGESVVYDLAAGESIRVHPGHVGMFQESVSFEIVTLAGVRNILFGNEGLFLARLTGPGRIWLQSLTVPGLAHALAPYLGGEQAESAAAAGAGVAAAGGLMRNLFGRN